MRHFVLVSGANANDLKLNKSFLYCVPLRADYLFHQHRGLDDLTVTWFEFTTGHCDQLYMDRKGRRGPQKALRKFKPITRASYEQRHGFWWFKDGQRDVMSIVDVYRFIEDLGKSDPRSVFELSIFSHAWEKGPVLVDSEDDHKYKDEAGKVVNVLDNLRDPDDKDGRIKDFTPNNRKLKEFQEAFNPDATIRNWGCMHTDRDVNLFKLLFRQKDYKSRGMKDSQELKVSLDNQLASDLFGSNLESQVKDSTLSCTFGDLRRFFHGELTGCYNAAIAVGAKTRTYGGAPGGGADFRTPQSGAAPMIIVDRAGHNKQILDFYAEYLSVEFDAQTHYALYPPQDRPLSDER